MGGRRCRAVRVRARARPVRRLQRPVSPDRVHGALPMDLIIREESTTRPCFLCTTSINAGTQQLRMDTASHEPFLPLPPDTHDTYTERHDTSLLYAVAKIMVVFLESLPPAVGVIIPLSNSDPIANPDRATGSPCDDEPALVVYRLYEGYIDR